MIHIHHLIKACLFVALAIVGLVLCAVGIGVLLFATWIDK